MFALIVTIMSIALVALLVWATVYHGGKTAGTAATRAAATTILNQSTQISAAGALSVANGPGWPATTLQFPPEIMTMPVPPAAAYLRPLTPTAQDWAYFSPKSHAFGLRKKLSKDVCMEINRQLGFYGIPMALGPGGRHQCFGHAEPYSYLNTPSDVPKEILDEIIAGTVQDATEELTTSPVETVSEDSPTAGGSGVISVAIPGYPVLCSSGLVINSGTCAGGKPGTGGTGPGTPSPPETAPVSKTVTTIPSVVALDGSPHDTPGANSLTVCTNDAPPGTVNMSAVFSIGGVPLTTRAAFLNDAAQCLGVSESPSMPEGPVPTRLVTSSGEVLTGTLYYANTPAAMPVAYSSTPHAGSAYLETVVTVTGSGFVEGTQAYAFRAALLTKFVNSTTLLVTMPPLEKLKSGWTGESNWNTRLTVGNPGSLIDGYDGPFFAYGAAPRMSSINVYGPAAKAGVTLNVVGSGLIPQATYYLGGVPMQMVSSNSTSVVELIVPQVSPGPHKIVMHAPGWSPVESETEVLVVP